MQIVTGIAIGPNQGRSAADQNRSEDRFKGHLHDEVNFHIIKGRGPQLDVSKDLKVSRKALKARIVPHFRGFLKRSRTGAVF